MQILNIINNRTVLYTDYSYTFRTCDRNNTKALESTEHLL